MHLNGQAWQNTVASDTYGLVQAAAVRLGELKARELASTRLLLRSLLKQVLTASYIRFHVKYLLPEC